MSAAYTLDAITLAFTDEDYKDNRPDPKLDTFFEWRVSDATVRRAKNRPNLTLLLKVEALDEQAAAMFPKWINITVPVSIPAENIVCPDYAKSMFLSQLAPLYPEVGPYDNVELDPFSGKKSYYKDGEQLSNKDFDVAKFESNKQIGAMARKFAELWMNTKDKATVDELLDRKFFGILKASTDGKYVNVSKMNARAPLDQEVVYSRKEAFKNK